jgi:hypothetical protein
MAPAAFEGTKTNKAGKGSYKLESGVDTDHKLTKN